MKTLASEIELFSFNDPPIVWFFWNAYKTRHNHMNRARQSRLIRKKPKIISSEKMLSDQRRPNLIWEIDEQTFKPKATVAVLDPLECDYFSTFFVFFFSFLCRGKFCLHITSVYSLFCQHSRNVVLISIFLWFLFCSLMPSWCFIEAKIMMNVCLCVC